MAKVSKNNGAEQKASLTLVKGKAKGRPKWMPDLKEVEKLASLGLSNEEIAKALTISTSTLYQHKKEYSDFSEALQRGGAKGIATVAGALYTKATSGDTMAIKFYLQSRAGWTDKITAQDPLSIGFEI